MDKVGMVRSIFYYNYKDLWEYFFKYLNVKYIVSSKTNQKILEDGIKYASDEMCLPLKIFLGHVKDLDGRCKYILIPREDNYKLNNQMCTNYISIYDIVKNTFKENILTFDIDIENHKTLKKGLTKVGLELNKSKREINKAYKYALNKYREIKNREISNNMNKLNSSKKKVLVVSHPYVIYDNLIGEIIIKYLEKNNITVIYSDKFDSKSMVDLSKNISRDLYFKYSKESLGSIVYTKDKIDGVIFVSAFPCSLDSLVNEMAMRYIQKPFINIIIDENQSDTGLETRLESFIDVIKGEDK